MMIKLSYVANQVKNFDNHRYLSSMFAEPKFREELYALYSLNIELEHIKLVTSQEMTKLIRLAWWREAIEELYYGKVRAHPVIEALASVVHKLDCDLLVQLVDSKEIEETEQILDYIEQSYVTLNQLVLQVIGVDDAVVAEQLGIAYGIVNYHLTTHHLSKELLQLARDDLDACEGEKSLLNLLNYSTTKYFLKKIERNKNYIAPFDKVRLLLAMV